MTYTEEEARDTMTPEQIAREIYERDIFGKLQGPSHHWEGLPHHYQKICTQFVKSARLAASKAMQERCAAWHDEKAATFDVGSMARKWHQVAASTFRSFNPEDQTP